MGHAVVRVKLVGESGEIEKELLVDTGSTYTWVRKDDLREVGVKEREKVIFATIEGRKIKRAVGRAEVEVQGRREFTIVVFAEKKDKEVLGVHALEGLRLEVDPVTGKLRESEAVLALWWGE